MVVADRGRGFVQVVTADIADAGMDTLDAGFRLLPVVAEFGFTTHRPLRFAQASFVLCEAVQWGQIAASRECCEPCNPHVDTDCVAIGEGRLNLSLCLDGDKPFSAQLAHGDVLDRAEYFAAVAIS
ncbi:MAG TPA: hypothetical protein PLZ37_02130 [Nitrospira sp.]|nr:hypothetical protein [Nitrospira sp.]